MLTRLNLNRLINFLAICLLASFLVACGGGGTNDGCQNIDPSRSGALPSCGGVVTNPGSGTSAGSVAIGLTDSGGTVFNALTPSRSAKVTAVVKDANNQPIANGVVTFTSTDSTAVFTPAVGTALTDSSGMASVQLAAGKQPGAFTVTASYTAGSTVVKATASYTVSFPSGGSAPTVTMVMQDSSGASFNAITPARGARLLATVRDSQNQPIVNGLVSFSSTDSTAVFVPASRTALTDANGVANMQLEAGAVNGAFSVKAAYANSSGAAEATVNYTVTLPATGSSPSLTLSMTDSSGAAFNALTPTRSATLTAVVRNSSSQPIPNTVVTFTSTDSTAVFSPGTGTALTDASGAASVQLAAGTKAGAFTANASATVGTDIVKSAINYTAAFPVLSFSDMVINPGTLAAGGNASVSISVLSGGSPYTQPVTVSFTSSCTAVGKATIGSPVITQNGVAVASYTDKGCGTADTITATASMPNATLSKTGVINVLPGTAGSIKFIGVDNANIALKGTGGPGRPEYSTVKFQVFDLNGSMLAGRQVTFVFADSNSTTGIGGMSLSPVSSTTAADGTVTTVVTAGTIPTSARVKAIVANSNPQLTSVSSVLVVSSGVPDQAHFSLSTEIGNCEGGDFDGLCSTVNVILGDHFGNPVPDGTAVNFTAEGGNIGASCVTKDGRCSVPFWSSSPRPANGRVTVMAYALGEETLIDNNGNNVFDSGDSFTDKSPDIYRDDNENGKWDAGEACVGPNTNGLCSTPGDGIYNGVLRKPQLPSAQALYVSASLVQQFSGSNPVVTVTPSPIICPIGSQIDVQVRVTDTKGILMPAHTSISFGTTWSGQTFPSSTTVHNSILGIGDPLLIPVYPVTITCPLTATPGKFTVTVKTPRGEPLTILYPVN